MTEGTQPQASCLDAKSAVSLRVQIGGTTYLSVRTPQLLPVLVHSPPAQLRTKGKRKMPELSPLVFGAVVFAFVGVAVFAPRFFSRPSGPTADQLYVDSLPSRYEATIRVPARPESVAVTPPEQLEGQIGAPRAPSPARQAGVSTPPPSQGLQPLKVPVN